MLARQLVKKMMIAAVAFVTRDFEPWAAVGGNPAGFIKKRELK